jgi:hypothetical protein
MRRLATKGCWTPQPENERKNRRGQRAEHLGSAETVRIVIYLLKIKENLEVGGWLGASGRFGKAHPGRQLFSPRSLRLPRNQHRWIDGIPLGPTPQGNQWVIETLSTMIRWGM